MATTKKQHRKDLQNCISTLAKRAQDLNEPNIAAVLYCLTGCIEANIESEHARISQELSMYLLISEQLQQRQDENSEDNSSSIIE